MEGGWRGVRGGGGSAEAEQHEERGKSLGGGRGFVGGEFAAIVEQRKALQHIVLICAVMAPLLYRR